MGVQLTILCKLSIFRLNVCCSLSRKIIVMTIPRAAYLVLKQSGAIEQCGHQAQLMGHYLARLYSKIS